MKKHRHSADYHNLINTIRDLKDKYPNQGVANHISQALADYGDIWGLSDKEFAFALEKYAATMDLDQASIGADYLDKVIEDGMDLDNILGEDEDDWLDTFDHQY